MGFEVDDSFVIAYVLNPKHECS